MEEYVLVRWPESQEYMELKGVVLANDVEMFGCSAYFVPKKLIKKGELND